MCNNSTIPVQPRAPQYLVVTSTILYVIIFFTGVVGNILVIVTIRSSRTLKTSVNMYLLNLCLADLLVLLVCMPTALAEIYTKEAWYFGGLMCKMVPFIENSVANASVLTIIAIGIERYRVVSNPLSVIDDSGSKIWKIVLGMWLIALAASAPCLTIAVYRESMLVDTTPIMVCRNPINKPWKLAYLILLNVMFFLLPSCILFGLYGHLCRLLMKTQQLNHQGPISGRVNYIDRKRVLSQVVNIIGSIVLIFFVCHLPLRVTGLYFILEKGENIKELGLESYLNILFFSRIMFYLNHALNPIVYNFVSTKFRSALNSLCSKRQKNCSVVSFDQRRKKSYNFTNNTKKSLLVYLSKYRRSQAIELDATDRNTRSSKRLISLSTNTKQKGACVYFDEKACNATAQMSSNSMDSSDTGRNLEMLRSSRQKMNDFSKEYRKLDTNQGFGDPEQSSSTCSSSKDYDLRIKVNQKAVCITLNMKKVGEKETCVDKDMGSKA